MTMTSWKRLGLLAVATILITSMMPSPAEAQAPIKVGASLSLTGTYAKPGTYAKEGYEICADELNIYAEAVKRAGTLDSDKVREQLLKIEMKTAFGDYKVDQDGFQLAHKMVMLQWQDGKRVIVWPDDLASGKARYPTPGWNQR